MRRAHRILVLDDELDLALSVTGHLQKPIRLKDREAMIEARQKRHTPIAEGG